MNLHSHSTADTHKPQCINCTCAGGRPGLIRKKYVRQVKTKIILSTVPSDPMGAFPIPWFYLGSRCRERSSSYKCFELSTHVLLWHCWARKEKLSSSGIWKEAPAIVSVSGLWDSSWSLQKADGVGSGVPGPTPLDSELYLGIGSSFLAVLVGSEDDRKTQAGGGASVIKYQKVLVILNVLCLPPYIIINLLDEAMERKTS